MRFNPSILLPRAPYGRAVDRRRRMVFHDAHSKDEGRDHRDELVRAHSHTHIRTKCHFVGAKRDTSCKIARKITTIFPPSRCCDGREKNINEQNCCHFCNQRTGRFFFVANFLNIFPPSSLAWPRHTVVTFFSLFSFQCY